MLDGIYRNPTEIYFGPSCMKALGPRVLQEGARVLLVYGGDSVHQCGVYEDVIIALRDLNINYVELSGVQPNPLADKVQEGIRLCKENAIELILAVGGGSVIDTAKVIAFGVHAESLDIFSWFDGGPKPEVALPFGVVLTLPGSGSESSGDAVISFTDRCEKRPISSPLLFPRFSFLNPIYTVKLSQELTMSGIWDAISHLLERYFTNEGNVDCSSRLSEGLIYSLMRTANNLLTDPENYDYRAEAMWGCKLAHDGTIGFGRKADWSTHRIAHEIAALFNTRHGSTLAVIFPAWMEFCNKRQPSLFEGLRGQLMDFSRHPDDDLANIFRAFIRKCGLPLTLSELGIVDHSLIQRIAAQSVQRQQSGTIGHFIRLREQDVKEILTIAS